MLKTLAETEDRSVWTDELEELTGKPRHYWSRLPFRALKEIYRREIQRRRRDES